MDEKYRDPFTENILANIPLEIRRGFSSDQLTALRTALATAHDRSRHMIDARVSIPLYFARYYIVFLLGRDLRRSTRKILLERRRDSSQAAGFTLVFTLIWNILFVLLVAGFVIIYYLKSTMGIDIFPDMHLWDIFRT
ncbi:MAG: hypothetical protein GY814_08475 [Gammaproteobacteria bacterium]|nr:hypothetical protein [Gammaproteobacteria bacterium]